MSRGVLKGWRAALTLCLLPGGLAVAAESTDGSRVENAFRGVMQDRSAEGPAEALYVEKCGMCHRQMGMGTVILACRVPAERAWLEAREDLTAPFIETAVRQGIGNMPRIPRAEVSDAQLDIVTAYLTRCTNGSDCM